MEAGGNSGIFTYALHPGMCRYLSLENYFTRLFLKKGGVKTDIAGDSLHPDMDKMQPGVRKLLYESNYLLWLNFLYQFIERWETIKDTVMNQTYVSKFAFS